MKKSLLIFGFAVFFISILSCSVEDDVEEEVEMKPIEFSISCESPQTQNSADVLGFPTCVTDAAKPGTIFSRVDSVQQYGLGMAYTLHDSLIGRGLTIKVSSKLQLTEQEEALVVISLESPTDHSFLFYDAKNLALQLMGKTNEWVNVATDVLINADLNLTNKSILKVYFWKPKGKGLMLVDDLKVALLPDNALE